MIVCDLCGKRIKNNDVKIPKRAMGNTPVWVHKACDDARYQKYGLEPPKLTTLEEF